MRPHISYNQMMNHHTCGFYHKLDKIDKLVPFTSSIYTAFGRAIHAIPEYAYVDEPTTPLKEELEAVFVLAFQKELEDLEKEGYFDSDTWKQMLESSAKFLKKSFVTKEEIIQSFVDAGTHISHWLTSEMENHFGNFKVLGIEEELRLPIPGHEDYDFLGYVDMIIETDEKIYLLDWKTASWGWAGYNKNTGEKGKKADKFTDFQLTLYKHFYMEKYGLQARHKKIDTVFVLLKRSPGKDKEGSLKNPVEFHRITSGPKKTQNSLKLLSSVVYNVKHKLFYKNRKSCKSFKGYSPCLFRFTKHCK